MDKYDELFGETAPTESVFAAKGALDPLARPKEVVARDDQERRLATILNGVHEGYLPTTVSVYGPPGTGKTLTVRRVCREFSIRTEDFGFEYVNLKDCRSLFSAANEMLYEFSGEKKGAYEGLDGVFEAIWETLETYPDWMVLILDEIDHIQQDSNYEPSEFFYRLLRGEGKLKRGLNLSVWLISNELLEVDLRLGSRVRSAMSGEEVFFPPYGVEELASVLSPRTERAFVDGALPDDVYDYGVKLAAHRWGDARKALTLFRQAGEMANERGQPRVTKDCFDANLSSTEREAVIDKLLQLPQQHFRVLASATGWDRPDGEIRQPVTTDNVFETYLQVADESAHISRRAIREIIGDLETMGLVDTWIESKGNDGRVKQIKTTFDPSWVRRATQEMVSAANGKEH